MVILTRFAGFLHGISIHSEKQKPNPNKLIETYHCYLEQWGYPDHICEKISQGKTKYKYVCIRTVPCKSLNTRCGKELDAVSFCCDSMTGLLADVNWHYSTAMLLAPCWLTSADDLPPSTTSFQNLACFKHLNEVRNVLVAIFRIVGFHKLKGKKNTREWTSNQYFSCSKAYANCLRGSEKLQNSAPIPISLVWPRCSWTCT